MDFALNPPTTKLNQLDLSLVNNRKNIAFPWKLHEMLEECEDEELDHIASWLPDNSSFRVHKPAVFMNGINTKFFNQTNYKSFQRQLNMWGFQRIIKGPNKGGYKHKYFVRSKESLCRMMTRQKIKGEKPSSSRSHFPFEALESSDKKKRKGEGIRDRFNILKGEKGSNGTNLPNRYFSNDLVAVNESALIYDVPKALVPFNRSTRAESNCMTNLRSSPARTILPSTRHAHSPSFDPRSNVGIISPRTDGYFSSDHMQKFTTSDLKFPEKVCDFDNETVNDEKSMFSRLNNSLGMYLPSPDPIAPNHPLSIRQSEMIGSTQSLSFNFIINSAINSLEYLDAEYESQQQ